MQCTSIKKPGRKPMPKVLSQAQVDDFWKDGYTAPVRAISTERAASIRQKLEAFEHSTGGPLSGSLRGRSHLLFTWLNDLIREERIVDAIEDLYGENLFLLGQQLLHQGSRGSRFRVMASGRDLLGSIQS